MGKKERMPDLKDRITELLFEREAFEDNPVTEQQLADEFGLSRTPIRDALKEIEKDRIIERVKGKGVYLRRLSVSEVAEAYDVRAALEAFAGRTAAQVATEHDIDQLDALARDVDDARKKADLPLANKLDVAFHRRISTLSGNATLVRTIDSLSLISRTLQPGRTPFFHDELKPTPYPHQAIVTAMRERDPEGAATLLQRHIEHGKQVMVEQTLGVKLNHFSPVQHAHNTR